MKKNKRRHHSQPAKQTHNPPPAAEPVPKDETPNSDPCAAEQNKEGKQPQKLERGLLRWTRVVGVFTAVLAGVGGIQAWAFIQSERAFITLSGMQFEGLHLTANKTIVLLADMKNSGKSTGFVNGLNITINFVPSGAKLPVKPVYIPGGTTPVGPIVATGTKGSRIAVKGTKGEPTIALSEEGVAPIQKGEVKLYVFGYISYFDEFSFFGNRITGFCHVYNPQGTSATVFDDCTEQEREYVYAH